MKVRKESNTMESKGDGGRMRYGIEGAKTSECVTGLPLPSASTPAYDCCTAHLLSATPPAKATFFCPVKSFSEATTCSG